MQIKGQISLMMILGILIVAIGVLIAIANSNNSELRGSADSDPISIYIESILKHVGEEGLFKLAKQGGLYNLDPHIMYDGAEKIALHYYDAGEIVPSKEELEKQLEEYIKDSFKIDLSDFENLIAIKSEPEVEILFSEKETLIKLFYVIEVKRGEDRITISEFQAVIPFHLLKYTEISKNIIKKSNLENNLICITCVDEFASQNNVFIDMFDIGDSDIMFIITDNNIKLNYEPLQFHFGVQIPGELSEKSVFEIQEIENLEADIGYKFEFQVESTKPATFTDTTPLFNITESGLISFLPGEKQVGNHLIEIIATDNEGNVDTEFFNFKINSFTEPIQVLPIIQLTAKVGEEFRHQIKVESKKEGELFFSNNSSIFDIDSNGVIQFNPREEHVGLHEVKVSIFDSKGAKIESEFTLMIT